MNEEVFYYVSEEILPSTVKKTAEAKDLLQRGEAKSIVDAVQLVGVGRSTFYKYKDKVFSIDEVK